MQTNELGQNAWVRFHDYEYSLILGLIIGVFLLPVEKNLNIGHSTAYIYLLSVCGFPILSLLGVIVAKFLFSRLPIIWQFVKFALIGVSNTAINFGVINLFVLYTGVTRGPGTAIYEAIAFLLAVLNSYFWNSHWSFENKNPRTLAEFMKFVIITVVGLLVSSATVYIVTTFISHPSITAELWVNIANLIATLITMFWNFSGFKFIVFRPVKDEPQV